MSTKFSQFFIGGLLRNSDTVVGLRNGNNFQFNNLVGVGDSSGNPIITWTQPIGPGSTANYIDFLGAFSGNAPTMRVLGTDTDSDLNIEALGNGHVAFTGTGAVAVPVGTTGQRPIGFAGGFRYNSTTDSLEYWNLASSAWAQVISGAAFDDATYITQTDETANLPNSVPLSTKASGFLVSTTGTGLLRTRILQTASASRILIFNDDGQIGDPTFDLATTAVAPGTYTNTTLTVDAYGRLTNASNGAATGTGSSLTDTITIANTFTAGQLVYLNGPVYTLAQANSTITSEVVGLISAASPTEFTLTTSGYVTGLSGLVAGTVYFLSDVTPGLMTPVAPTTIGFIMKPVFVADSATSGYFINYRGKIIPGATGAVSALTDTIIVANTFAVGELLYINAGTYARASATTDASAEVIGIVTAASPTQFTIATDGYVAGLSGLVAGATYYLSDVAGGMTTTQPTTAGYIVKAVLVADTPTSGYFVNYLGKIVPASTGTTGTGATVLQISPTITTPILTTPNIVGVINASNAAAGSVGEVITSVITQAGAIAVLTATATNLTSIVLTPGDWDVYGNIGFFASLSAMTSSLAWTSLTSATLPSGELLAGSQGTGVFSTYSIVTPFLRVNVSVNTTVYLSGYVVFASGTCNMAGKISARRIR